MIRKRKVLASGIEYIDPADCGSTVGYYIVRSSHGLSAEVELTDCNRKINWYFSGKNKESVQKIDNAIRILTDFRRELLKARRGR